MKRNYFYIIFVFFLFLSFTAQSQFYYLTPLDTIGAEPTEFPSYIKKHKITRMTKVLLGEFPEEDGQTFKCIAVGDTTGTIYNIKEYDENGNALIDIAFVNKRFVDHYQYEYDSNSVLKEKGGSLGYGEVIQYQYNSRKKLERLKFIDIDIDSVSNHTGDVYFYYDNENRITQSVFLYEDYNDTVSLKHDTTEIITIHYEKNTAKINVLTYMDEERAIKRLQLDFNENGQTIRKANYYKREEYEYNKAGLIIEKREYDRHSNLDATKTYFYNENNLLTHSIETFRHIFPTKKVIYIYEFH